MNKPTEKSGSDKLEVRVEITRHLPDGTSYVEIYVATVGEGLSFYRAESREVTP